MFTLKLPRLPLIGTGADYLGNIVGHRYSGDAIPLESRIFSEQNKCLRIICLFPDSFFTIPYEGIAMMMMIIIITVISV